MTVTPVQPPAGYTAQLSIFNSCIAGATLLSSAPGIVPAGGSTAVNISLTNGMKKGDQVCVTEHYIYAGHAPEPFPTPADVATKIQTAVDPPNDSMDTGAPSINQSYTDDKEVWIVPVSMGPHYTATLTAYTSCTAGASALSAAIPIAAGSTIPVAVPLAAALSKGASVCVVEHYITAGLAAKPAPPPSDSVSKKQITIDRTPGPPFLPSGQTKLALSRIIGGIDVSSSASVDPAAHFLLDASFDAPLSNRDDSLYNTIWGSGYVRLASIAQPGAISGVANIGTYIKPLTDSTPNHLVQSVEANLGGQVALPSFKKNLGVMSSFAKVTLEANIGVITPLSISQANPVIYIVTQDIYKYYTTNIARNGLASSANAAILSACGDTFDAAKPCYLAYIPQDRSRFFRNYSAGLVFKKYYYAGGSSRDDDSFLFPGIATFTVGQNEYVTRGQLRGLVLHVDATWPLPGALSGRFAGGLYAFGALDANVTDKNVSSQQFLLPTASSTITLTSIGVAAIPVAQPNRDRYRFGMGVDLVKLISTISATVNRKPD